MKLPEEVKKLFEAQQVVALATADTKGIPTSVFFGKTSAFASSPVIKKCEQFSKRSFKEG